jgi:beta-glucanase (GH16 family)
MQANCLVGPASGAAGPWNLIFDDEFSGSSLDLTKWATCKAGTGPGAISNGYNVNDQCVYDPAQISVGGGVLSIAAIVKGQTPSGGTYEPYTSGSINTFGSYGPGPALFSFVYGYMETRMWLPLGATGTIANWPGFAATGENWPTDGELDVMEAMADGGYNLPGGTFIYAGPTQEGTTYVPGVWGGGWHTFAADWEPGAITYYYDGRQVFQYTAGITSAPMYIIVGQSVSSIQSPPVILPATLLVDYVRVWQH